MTSAKVDRELNNDRRWFRRNRTRNYRVRWSFPNEAAEVREQQGLTEETAILTAVMQLKPGIRMRVFAWAPAVILQEGSPVHGLAVGNTVLPFDSFDLIDDNLAQEIFELWGKVDDLGNGYKHIEVKEVMNGN